MRGVALLRIPALAGFFVGALLLTGCATPQVDAALRDWPHDVPVRSNLAHVPFHAQEDYECGPAALAMAASAAGVSRVPEQLVDQVYVPGRQGSLQQEMLAAGRRQGLLAYPLAPQLLDVLREVAAGHPVIVFQNLSLPLAPVWHYAVVVGYDREARTLWLHSGRTPRMEISFDAFERTWGRAAHWAMLLLPPGQLPATVQAGPYLAAAAALERVDAVAAYTAYQRARQAWPDQRLALLGLGSTAYRLGRWREARAHFQALTDAHPAFAPGWHNLAQVAWELGDGAAASVAIARAVALGGAQQAQSRALQQKIESGVAPRAGFPDGSGHPALP